MKTVPPKHTVKDVTPKGYGPTEEVELDEAIPKSTGIALVHRASKKIVAKGNKEQMMKKMKELNSKEKGSHHLGSTYRGKVGDTFGEEVEQRMDEDTSMSIKFTEFRSRLDEASYMGKGNHKPGWMLRADPELARKFKEIEDRKKRMNSMMKKYGGKTGDEIAKMKKEEVESVAEGSLSGLEVYMDPKDGKVKKYPAKPTSYNTPSKDNNHNQPRGTSDVKNRLKIGLMKKEEVEQVDEVIGNTTGYSDSGPRNKADERKFHQMRNVVTKGPRKGKITKFAQNRLKDRLKTKTHMEEVEQVDELKQSTLGSYIKKASHDVATKSAMTRHFATKSGDERAKQNYTQARKDDETSNKLFNKSWKRRQGIAKAVDRLTKKEVEIS
jgi:ATP-dependent protease ClpP protease subunit